MIRLETPVKRRPIALINAYSAGRRRRGLGFTYNDLLAQAGNENCDPKDSRCVARNEERQVAVEDLWVTTYMTHPETANQQAPAIHIDLDNSDAALARFMNNQPLVSEDIGVNGSPTRTVAQIEGSPSYATSNPQSLFTPGASAPGGASGSGGASGKTYTPRAVFSNTSGGSAEQLVSGDYWKIEISGGAPNAAVFVTGGKNGARDRTPAGSTDANGYLKIAGQVTDTEIGAWSEDWTVAGTSAGSVAFNVTAKPAPLTTGGGIPPTGHPTGGAGFTLPAALQDLPWYAWAGGVAAVLTIGKMVFGGHR